MNFEFVGVMELLLLEAADDEVWYDIKRMVSPRERRGQLLLPGRSMHAFRMEAERRPATKGVTRRDRPQA